MSIANNLFY